MDKTISIIKLHIIRFGSITEQVFTFKDGINIIYGENRSGKTTLCEFIRFMYYGFEGRDAEDYYPYGSPNRSVCGSMTVKAGSKTIEIFREKSTQTESLVLTDTERAIPYSIGESASPGEYFLGIKSALFDRSLYCPQDMSGLVSDGELSRHENAILLSYSGEYDFSAVCGQLSQHRNELTNPEKTGKLDLAEEEYISLEGELSGAILKQNDIMQVEAEIAKTAQELLEVEKATVIVKADIENLRNQHVEEESRRLAVQQQELEKARELYERLRADAPDEKQLELINEHYESLGIQSEQLNELEERLANTKSNLDIHNTMIDKDGYDEETLNDISDSVEKRARLSSNLALTAIIAFVTGAIAFTLLYVFAKSFPLIYNLAISGTMVFASAVLLILSISLTASKNSLYRRVGAQNAEEFEDIYDTYRSLSQTTDIYRNSYRDEARAYKEKAELYSQSLTEMCEILGISADTSDMSEISERVRLCNERYEKARAALDECERIEQEIEKSGGSEQQRIAEQNALLLHEREKELAMYNAQHDALHERRNSLEQIVSTAIIHNERPVYIKTQLNILADAISEYRKDIAALDIASDVVNDALAVMRFRIKEHLVDSVNHFLRFTLQEGERMTMDDNYCLQYKNQSRLFPVFADNLSRTSRAAKGLSRSLCEMAALALRIALIQLLEAESSAAIFDEPFAFMDASGEDRMIKKLANSDISQVFLFTSHRIDDAEEKYNCIHLI